MKVQKSANVLKETVKGLFPSGSTGGVIVFNWIWPTFIVPKDLVG